MRAKIRHSNSLVRDGFAILPVAVLRDVELSAGARVAYAELAFRAFLDRTDALEDAQAEIAAAIGVGVRTLGDYLRELRKKGLVETRRRGRGLPNLLVVHDPRSAESADLERQNPPARTADSAEPHARASEQGKREKRERPRNVFFDVLVGLFGAPAPHEASHYGKRATEIRKAIEAEAGTSYVQTEASDAMVERVVTARFGALVKAWGRERVTIDALVKHWTFAGQLVSQGSGPRPPALDEDVG